MFHQKFFQINIEFFDPGEPRVVKKAYTPNMEKIQILQF